MIGSGAWALTHLSQYVVALSAVTDPWRAVATAVEYAAQSLGAQLAAVVHVGGAVTRTGVADDATLSDALAVVHADRSRAAPPPGGMQVAWVDLDDDVLATLLVVRSAACPPFSDDDRTVLHAFGRALLTVLRLLDSLEGERALREESEEQVRENADLADELQQRQELVDHLLDIQRSVSRQVPLQDVLDRITRSTAALLEADFVGLRLVDEPGQEHLRLVSGGGVDDDLVAVARRSLTGAGIAALAMQEQRLVVRHDYAEDSDAISDLVDVGVRFAMSAPVFVNNEPVGCLSVASRNRGLGYGPDGQQVLRAFAEQASLALTGAQTLERMNEVFRDPLTGLPNRMLFLDRLRHALSRIDRSHVDVAVLLVALDRFKTVNDGLGHAFGDRLLTVLAARVGGCLRAGDTAARLGGDEIAVLSEDVSLLEARETAERVLACLREPVQLDGREVVISASIGIAHTSDTTADAGEMLRNADVAMYRAKQVGGDQVRVYEPGLHAAALLRMELEGDLRRALRRQELRLVYQPVVELASLRIVGVEALLRWDHPERGPVPPEAFIPVAEETGLIVDIGRWVLESACAQAKRWQALDLPRALSVSVNVSARQLQRAQLLDDVTAALQAADLPAGRLAVELTETALMQDPQTAGLMLHELKQAGVTVVLDDFGTGYSSLNYLREFPIDVMKIDRSFISGVGGEQRALATTMVGLARDLQLDTVAEGIETEAELDFLRGTGCVLGQGFHFSRPLPADELTAVLARGTYAPATVQD